MENKALVIAPHPDDEVLGVGGTMAKLSSEGAEIYVIIVTKGFPPLFDEKIIERSRREALEAHKFLGVRKTIFLDFPAVELDTITQHILNDKLLEEIEKIKPDIVFVPFNGDIHKDHQIVFLSALTAMRPGNSFSPSKIYAYETLSETNWYAPYITPNFIPNLYIDISLYLEKKIEAMKIYSSQIKNFPHERSAETIEALAKLRGSTVNLPAAEAFVIIREIVK